MQKRHLIVPFLIGFLSGCASLPQDINRPFSEALNPDPTTTLGRAIAKPLAEHPQKSGFYPLDSGFEALIARLASVSVAERSIDLQYYIWHNDLTGRLLMHRIIEAADRGVRIRILLDDLNQGKYEELLAVLDSHPQIEVRMANPFAGRSYKILDALRFSTVNKRMHNKVFIVDNQTAIVGGRNIGNEYFAASAEMNFGDFDLWAIGPVVPELSKEFDSYWNSEIAYPISSLVPKLTVTPKMQKKLRESAKAAVTEVEKTPYAQALRQTPMAQKFTKEPLKLYWGDALVVVDPPRKFKNDDGDAAESLAHQLYPLIQNTREELILVSPYFIPGKNGVKFFENLRQRDVQAVVLTNSLASSDVATVFSGYKGYRRDLLKTGVHLYEMKAQLRPDKKKRNKLGSSFSSSGLHGKIFVFDRTKVFVGSMNLDPRSVTLNSEMGVVVDSPELAQVITQGLLETFRDDSYRVVLNQDNDLRWKSREGGKEVLFKKEPDTSWWKRFKASLSSIFIPESWL